MQNFKSVKLQTWPSYIASSDAGKQLFSGSKCTVNYILNKSVVDKVTMLSKSLGFFVLVTTMSVL